MNDDDTRDGLPRFIYGEYTGEMRLPERPVDPDGDERPRPMDRQTMILLGAGGLALAFIIGLVVLALNTGGPDNTPAAASVESVAASGSSGVPSPTASPEPSQSWPMATDIGQPGGTPKATKTTKPGTTPGTTQATTPGRHTTPPHVPKSPVPPTIIQPPR
jgi:hypothetical protein